MITLTERAATELKDLITTENKAGAALRVWVSGGGCSGLSYGMALDDNPPEADDQVYVDQGVKVYIDSLSLGYMTGSSVDYVDDPMGGGFKIENPNAVSTCGCGSSFSTEEGGSCGCGGGCGCGSQEAKAEESCGCGGGCSCGSESKEAETESSCGCGDSCNCQ